VVEGSINTLYHTKDIKLNSSVAIYAAYYNLIGKLKNKGIILVIY